MGLASSQARLLLLTARKSDLEFRAQQITNSEMILAMQTEEIARTYSLKLSNQTLKYIDPKNSTETEITASTLGSLSANGARMKLQEYGGKDADGEDVWYDWVENGQRITGYTGPDGKEISLNNWIKMGRPKDGYKPIIQQQDKTNNYSGPAILEGVNGGTLRIVYDNGANTVVDAINGTQFSVAYNTKDDAAAEAEYRKDTASLQIKEKRLQMDLQQVETQQKACDTEMDSVKKIIDKSIERGFKVFS